MDTPFVDTQRCIGQVAIQEAMAERLAPGAFDKLSRATVGIAGLGGLGSVVAVALARSCIGALVIADFDVIDAGNLNRQQYFINQLGQSKVDAMRTNLRRINPNVSVIGFDNKLTPENIPRIFRPCQIVAECFDLADQKQMIVETVLAKMPEVKIVSACGVAGLGNSNNIKTRVINDRHVITGDFESPANQQSGLLATRVGIVACYQANAIVELIVNGAVNA